MKKLLVVVDMQKDFVTGCLGTQEAKEIVPKIKNYMNDFYKKNASPDFYYIAFTRDTHKENYLETQEGKNLPVTHCIENTEGWQIVPELQDIDKICHPYIFNKETFGSLELGKFIKDGDFDEVQFCGVCTGICVISNALLTKAFAPETKVVVLEDLCACVTKESHETALKAMKTCQINIDKAERLLELNKEQEDQLER